MKRVLYNLCFLLALTCVFAATAGAQQKIGYVDTDFLVTQIPEYQSVQQQLSSISQQWREELKQMQQEIDTLKEDFESREILYTEDIRKQKEQELNNKIKQRQQYLEQKFGSNGEYFEQQKQLLQPIQRRVFDAIAAVAERGNFDFVFDRSQKTEILYAREAWNLNEEVLLELGIQPEETSN